MKIFSLCLFIIFALQQGVFASTIIYVNDNIGSDYNTGLDAMSPVTSSNGDWTRVSELGVTGADTGIVIQNAIEYPSFLFATEIIGGKIDQEQRTDSEVLIIRHLAMPTAYISESMTANLRTIITIIWQVFTLPNGRQAERMIGTLKTVEAY
jgi:hypothetical protein